jgi:hypothetical protein
VNKKKKKIATAAAAAALEAVAVDRAREKYIMHHHRRTDVVTHIGNCLANNGPGKIAAVGTRGVGGNDTAKRYQFVTT